MTSGHGFASVRPVSRRLLVNAVMSVAQVVVIGVVYFILYRFLLENIGIEVLGIWSVSAISIRETNPRRKNSCLTACRPLAIPKRSFLVER